MHSEPPTVELNARHSPTLAPQIKAFLQPIYRRTKPRIHFVGKVVDLETLLIIAVHDGGIDEDETFQHAWSSMQKESECTTAKRMAERDESAFRVGIRGFVRRKKGGEPGRRSGCAGRYFGKIVLEEFEHVARMVHPADNVAENMAIDAASLARVSAVKHPNLVNLVLAAELFGLQLLDERFERWFKDLFVETICVGEEERDSLSIVAALRTRLGILMQTSRDDSVDCHPELRLVGFGCFVDAGGMARLQAPIS